jgi:hypothetical protein
MAEAERNARLPEADGDRVGILIAMAIAFLIALPALAD